MLERIKPLKSMVCLLLDELPEKVWTSKTTTFLDPAMGGGQFVSEIEARLRTHGHSEENIASRVYGFENNRALVNLAVNMYNLKGQYSKLPYKQFLNSGTKMKFDVIVGNPPYQDSSKTEKGGSTLWSMFVKKNILNICNKDGWVIMVTPIAWMTFGKSGAPIKGRQLKTVYTNIAHYFNVGSTFSAWVLENKPTYKETHFKDENFKLDLRGYDSLPAGRPIRGVSIVNKVMNWNGEFIKPYLETTLKGGWSERQEKFLNIDASLTKSKVYQYPVFHTNSLTYYVKTKPTDFDKPKIIISVTSPYPKVYTEPLACAPGDLRTYILIENEQDGIHMLSYLNSKLFRFVWRKPGMISWKSMKLPKLTSKIWTDAELYKLFDLTEEEIEIVEKYAL